MEEMLPVVGERAREAGYDAQMTKPIEFDQLFDMIENLAGEMTSSA